VIDWRARVAAALPAITGDGRRDAEIRDELVQHCLDRVDDLVREGLPRAAAEARALADLAALARRPRDLARAAAARGADAPGLPPAPPPSPRWRRALDDLPATTRALRRAPGFAIVALVTIALAVAAGTLAFAVIRGVLLRPLPVAAPDRLVTIWETSPTGSARNPVASGNFADWSARARSFTALAAMQGPFDLILSGGGDPERLRGVMATVSLGTVLAIAPRHGRLFEAADGVPGGPRIALATSRFWRRRLGGDASAVGRTLVLSGQPYTVIGVLPDAAGAVLDDADIVLPVRFTDAALAERRSHNYYVLGRLRDGVTLDQANAEMDAVVAGLAREHPQALTNWGISVVSTHADLVRDIRPLLALIFGVVVVMVAVAGVNLGNLQLARSTRRAGEMAVRAALGASRGRLAGLLAMESGLLACLGGVAGVALAAAALPSALALSPVAMPLPDRIVVDGAVVAWSAAIALVCAGSMALAAVLAAWRGGFRPLADVANTRVTAGRQRLRHALIAAQVALSVVLLVAAALLTQSLLRVRSVDHGFDPSNLLAVRLDLPRARYADAPAQVEFYERLIERLRQAPGIAAVAGTTGQPAVSAPMTFSFAIHGRPSSNPTGREHPVPLQAVTGGYFETMRIAVRGGRVFTADDRAGRPGVVVINDALARLHWADESAIGQRISFRPGETPWLEIVGIVGDTRDDGLDQEAPPTIYVPLAQKPANWSWMSWQTLVVRGTDDPAALVPTIRAVLRGVDPNVPVLEATPIVAWFAEQGAPRRFAAQLTIGFAVLAVLLGAIGVHGVLAYTVNARRREIAIRVALGAPRAHLLAAVVRTTLAFTLAGLVIGAIAAANVTRFLESLLYGVGATDVPTFVGIGLLLFGVAALATWLPARRALAVSAASELRRG
jgi:predicted permease